MRASPQMDALRYLRSFAAISIIVMLLVPVASRADNNDLPPAERAAAEEKMRRIKAILQKQDVDIAFYGRVSDQHGIPVDCATVEVHISCFDPDAEMFMAVKTVVFKTDNDGAFSVEGKKGRSLYIKSISKPGYEGGMLQGQERNFEYAGLEIPKPFVPDKNTPVSFHLRKQGDTTFLLRRIDWSCQVSVKESGKSKGYDFIRREPVRDMTRLVLNDEPLVCDIQMTATFKANDGTWAAVLSPGNPTGGIIVTDQLLYEAPETGYQPEYAFTPEDRQPTKATYIYLRSRDPAIYSRVELEYSIPSKRVFLLRGKSVTNPYGERNLEQANDLPYELTKRLTEEVEKSFRQNQRPPKPDLPKLIKEAQEKAEKDKGKP